MKTLLAAFLLLGCSGASGNAAQNEAAAAGAPRNLAAAGRYRDNAGPDVVVELELGRDGRFRFGMAAGSLDARAEGRWTSDGRTVVLTTEPRPTPPAFTAGPVSRSSEHPLSILVNWPTGEGIATIDVRVGMADGRVLEGYTQDYGWQPDEGETVGTPAWVELSELIQGVPLHRFQLDAAAGNVFAFTLVPNDMGIAEFRETEAEITPEGGLNIPFRGDMLPMVRAE
jgi:hypothetical protein